MFWNDGYANVSNSFVEYSQVFNDKMASKLKTPADVPYPIQVLIKLFSQYRRGLIKLDTLWIISCQQGDNELKASCPI